MPEEEAVGIKADYIDGGSFKTEIGNTTYLVRFFLTIQSRKPLKIE